MSNTTLKGRDGMRISSGNVLISTAFTYRVFVIVFFCFRVFLTRSFYLFDLFLWALVVCRED